MPFSLRRGPRRPPAGKQAPPPPSQMATREPHPYLSRVATPEPPRRQPPSGGAVPIVWPAVTSPPTRPAMPSLINEASVTSGHFRIARKERTQNTRTDPHPCLAVFCGDRSGRLLPPIERMTPYRDSERGRRGAAKILEAAITKMFPVLLLSLLFFLRGR